MTSRELDDVHDSPTGWVARHVHGYVESDGKRGDRWHGVDTLLLTTRGRRTGNLRRTALIYGRDGDRYVVVASAGGTATHPSWYLNLVDQPTVEIWPEYERYQARTERQIPVVVLEPTAE